MKSIRDSEIAERHPAYNQKSLIFVLSAGVVLRDTARLREVRAMWLPAVKGSRRFIVRSGSERQPATRGRLL